MSVSLWSVDARDVLAVTGHYSPDSRLVHTDLLDRYRGPYGVDHAAEQGLARNSALRALSQSESPAGTATRSVSITLASSVLPRSRHGRSEPDPDEHGGVTCVHDVGVPEPRLKRSSVFAIAAIGTPRRCPHPTNTHNRKPPKRRSLIRIAAGGGVADCTGWHVLRRTAGTLVLRAGLNLKDVQALLGH